METPVLVRGLRGGGVTAVGQAVQLSVQFAGAVVLSRLLAPEDFGLVAMVAVFMAVGELLRDFGMPTAALQARTLSHQQASNLFWVNAAFGAGAGLLLLVATPAITSLYDEPRLAHIVPVMAVALLCNGLQAQLQVQLARAMRFVSLATTGVLSQAAGLAVGITGALAGWGYWALVAQLVSATAVLLVSRAVAARWVPRPPRRGHGSGHLLRAGGNFGLAQLLTFAANNADTVMIGARWDAGMLGFYNRAFQLLTVPVQGLLGPLTQVVVPTVNSVSDGRRPSDVLLKAQSMLGIGVVWVFLVTAATADSLIPLGLGPQWEASVPLFQILAIGGSVWVFSFISYWIFIVEQQSRQLLYYNLVTKTLSIILVVGASFVSVQAVAWAYSIGLAVSWPVNLVWLARCTRVDSWSFFRNGVRIIAAAAVAFLATRFVLGDVHLTSDTGNVLVGACVATAVYLAALAVTPGGRQALSSSVRTLSRVAAGRG